MGQTYRTQLDGVLNTTICLNQHTLLPSSSGINYLWLVRCIIQSK
jgi:hypothetical protein